MPPRTIVKNINGTSKPKYSRNISFIKQYRRHFKLKDIIECSNSICGNDTKSTYRENSRENGDIVGAHVIQKEEGTRVNRSTDRKNRDMAWYVVPLCRSCNNKKDVWMTIKKGIELMPLVET